MKQSKWRRCNTMLELRWILLFVGLAIIATVYFLWGRKQKSKPRSDASRQSADDRQEPRLGELESAPQEATSQYPWDEAEQQSPSVEEPRVTAPQLADPGRTEGAPGNGETKIVVLHVAAPRGERFAGPILVKTLQAEHLRHGKYKIFHRAVASGETVFSVASMIEPGSIDLDRIDALDTPGLSLFMTLPGPQDGASAFADMLATARRLASSLNGDVLDETGSTLTKQTSGYIRDDIVAFQSRYKLVNPETTQR